MEKIGNPYGVGASGATRNTQSRLCKCCDLLFLYETWKGDPRLKPLHCPECEDHFFLADEPLERTLSRASSHARVYRDRCEHARTAATRLESETIGLRQKTKAALRDRDGYKSGLARVLELHRPVGDKCAECKKLYPCPTDLALHDDLGSGRYRAVDEQATYLSSKRSTA